MESIDTAQQWLSHQSVVCKSARDNTVESSVAALVKFTVIGPLAKAVSRANHGPYLLIITVNQRGSPITRALIFFA